MEPEKKKQIEEFADGVIKPIMETIYEKAFDCIETYKGDSNEPIKIPFSVHDGILETLDEIIEHCESQAGWADGASVISFALGKDGMRPGRQFRSMAKIATALRDLIKAKDDQIKTELSAMQEHEKTENMAKALGFQ